MWLAFKALSLQAKAGILIGILAILVAAIGTAYYTGYSKGENISRLEISKYEGKVKDLITERDKAQAKVDVKEVVKYKDRVQYIDRVVYKTKTVVETSVPEQFKFSKGWVYAYNQSVAGNELESSKASDASESRVSDRSALVTITENNGICLSNKAQLDALQSWIRETEKVRVEVTK